MVHLAGAGRARRLGEIRGDGEDGIGAAGQHAQQHRAHGAGGAGADGAVVEGDHQAVPAVAGHRGGGERPGAQPMGVEGDGLEGGGEHPAQGAHGAQVLERIGSLADPHRGLGDLPSRSGEQRELVVDVRGQPAARGGAHEHHAHGTDLTTP